MTLNFGAGAGRGVLAKAASPTSRPPTPRPTWPRRTRLELHRHPDRRPHRVERRCSARSRSAAAPPPSRPSSTPRCTTRCCTRTCSATTTASTWAWTARCTPSTPATPQSTPTSPAGTSTGPRPSSRRSWSRTRPATPPSRWSTTTPRPACCPSGCRTTARPTSWSATRPTRSSPTTTPSARSHFDAAPRSPTWSTEATAPNNDPARPQLPGAVGYLPSTAPTAAATTTGRSPPRWSTTPPTSPSRPSPGRSASTPTQSQFPARAQDWRTCSTRSATSCSAKLAGRKLGARLRAAQHVNGLRRGRLAGLHRHGAVQRGRPGRRQGRQRAAMADYLNTCWHNFPGAGGDA